ncbi:MAG TPA: hypothetical protein VFV35_02555 [Acidimicrobiales bacterium]|nr:hypothetical protein [Acidimicrobiales bacterium]
MGIASKLRALATHEARRLVLPLAALTALSTVGTAAAPTLAGDQPLVLVAMSPRLGFLAIAAHQVALLPFLVVGLVRLCVADPFHFALGRRHGARAIARLPGRLGRGAAWLQRKAGRSLPLLVFVRPNGTNLAIAGASSTSRAHVAVADVVGTAVYLLLVHTAGASLV